MREVTQFFIPSKNVTEHSKPFWCPELTTASEEPRLIRRKIRYKSNHANLENIVEAKETVKRFVSEKASEWMEDYLKALWHKGGKDFWVSYRTLFSESSPQVGLIKNK